MSEPKHFWDLRVPLETHPFKQDAKNDFVCEVCKKPRAMHGEAVVLLEPKPEPPRKTP